MNSKRTLVVTMGLLALALPCAAHDTWLIPREPVVAETKPMMIDLTSGTSFPKLESAIKADRVRSGGWRTSSASGGADKHEEGPSSLVMYVTPTGEGTAVMYLTLKPKEIDLDADEVAHYFDEIGAPESIRRDWADEGEDATFHETYTKHAKSYVRVGDEGADETCLRPVGLAIELLPQSDPTALSVGESLVVKAVKGGDDELESFAVGIVCGATGKSQLARTNQSGFVEFEITDAGWWLVRATELRRNADGTFASDFSTIAFFVEKD